MGKKLQKIFCILLAVVLILGVAPLHALAAEQTPATSGKAGDSVTWRVEGDTVYLEGTGRTYDFPEARNEPWTPALWAYRNEHPSNERYVHKMVIGSGITYLGKNSMAGLNPWCVIDLTFRGDFPEIAPDAMLTMGTVIIARYPSDNPTYTQDVRTVYGGTEQDPMTSWIWAGSDGSIDGQGGQTIRWTIQDHVLKLTGSGHMFPRDPGEGNYYSTFRVADKYLNAQIREIDIADGILDIPSHDFGALRSLTTVHIPDSVTFIGQGAFEATPITELTLPPHLEYLGMFAFNASGFSSLEEMNRSPLNLHFTGDAPSQIMGSVCQNFYLEPETNRSGERVFNIYYPEGNTTWTGDVQKKIGGTNYFPEGPEPEYQNPFTDLKPDEYYVTPVLWAVNNAITTGATETTFAPERRCTRAEIVTFLWRNEGRPEPKAAQNPFTDLNLKEYYVKPILWAVENGITTGETPTTFAPGKTCTRAQAVTFLWRCAGCPKPQSTEHPFTDIIHDYYYDAVLWAVENGITTGETPTTFAPGKTCTRAQIVTFLYRSEHR